MTVKPARSGTGEQGSDRVAAVVTEIRNNSHAELIVGRLLGELGHVPRTKLVSVYLDQVPENDLGHEMCARHGVPVLDTIEAAVSLGAPEEPVTGVVVIGEHGDYPWNSKGQRLYPRRRFVDEVLAAVDRHGLRPSIFMDKHLSYDDRDSRAMYDGVTSRGIPTMAGSSIPHVDTQPAYDRSELRDLTSVLVVSHGGHESYGFHALELMQSLAEHREGAETGVASVVSLQGQKVWQALDDGAWPRELLESALQAQGLELSRTRVECGEPALFVVEYLDGTRGYVAQLDGVAREWSYAYTGRQGTAGAAVCVTGHDRPYEHFGRLTTLIEDLIVTRRAPFRLERTLLATHMVNAAMESLFTGAPQFSDDLRVAYVPTSVTPSPNAYPAPSGEYGTW